MKNELEDINKKLRERNSELESYSNAFSFNFWISVGKLH